MVELNKLESKILQFIDGETWDADKPKIEMRKTINRGILPHRIKIRWMQIQKMKYNKDRFDSSAYEFEGAVYNLKLNKLITSRTICQLLAGLTCTELGHEMVNSL